MNCTKFLESMDDFIFDKIEYSEDLEDFLNHLKSCKSCKEELELYYIIRRGLGDIESPSDDDDGDVLNELNSIVSFYEEIFEKQRFMKKAGKISIIVFGMMVICALLYIYFRLTGRV